MNPDFDAIVVGAGPTGCACAYTLAKAGVSTLLIERGKYPGAKNVWGGALYGSAIAEVFPDYKTEAPIERYLSRHSYSMLTEKSTLRIEYGSNEEDLSQSRGFTVIRAKFDRWMAGKAEQTGAVVAAGLAVEDLLMEGGRVIGVKAGGDDITAHVVVACDGVNSALARKAGLRGELKPREVKQGVKEVLALPKEVIEERFNLKDQEGLSWQFLGCTQGMAGGGFIYTNKESLAVGLVVPVGDLAKKKINTSDLLEDFKNHPAVSKLIEGGELVEYSAHLIPTVHGNYPRLHMDGMLVAGDAAGYLLNTGYMLEGANFGLTTGRIAAEAVVQAKEKGDFSTATLSAYQNMLKSNLLIKDLETFKRADHLLENPMLYTTFPELACAIADRVFDSKEQPRKKLFQILNEERKPRVSLWQLLKFGNEARKAI